MEQKKRRLGNHIENKSGKRNWRKARTKRRMCWILTDSILATVSNTLALERNNILQAIIFFPSFLLFLLAFWVCFFPSYFCCLVFLFWQAFGFGRVNIPNAMVFVASICFNFIWSLFLIYSRFHMTETKQIISRSRHNFFSVRPVIRWFCRYFLFPTFHFEKKGRTIAVKSIRVTVDEMFCESDLAISYSWKCHLMPNIKIGIFLMPFAKLFAIRMAAHLFFVDCFKDCFKYVAQMNRSNTLSKWIARIRWAHESFQYVEQIFVM